MSLDLSRITLGDFELYTIENGRFKLDGGAMFGVVPKTMWEKKIPADANNCIHMALKSLLIRSRKTGRVYLIDLGIGDKFDEKMSQIYGVTFELGDMASSLAHHGFSTEDITDIIFTHLHFDHCGGISSLDENGVAYNNFPNAHLWITKAQWETATQPNARETASFLPENIEPIKASRNLHLIDEDHEFEPGFTHLVVHGHTKGQQLPMISAAGKTLVFAADLYPTYAHVPLPWVMGYDMYPATTLKEKEVISQKAVENNWYFFLQHDAQHEVITFEGEGRKTRMGTSLRLFDLSD